MLTQKILFCYKLLIYNYIKQIFSKSMLTMLTQFLTFSPAHHPIIARYGPPAGGEQDITANALALVHWR